VRLPLVFVLSGGYFIIREMKQPLNESWYGILIEDIKLQESTGIVATKHAIGKRILQDFEKLGKPQYGEKRVKNIAEDSGIAFRELKRCIQFANRFPELGHDVTQLSWHKIANELLPEHKEEKESKEDWFEQHTDSAVEAFALKFMIKAQQKIEKDFGIVYLNEFSDAIHQILELGVTHINYKETWKQE
jgi:hypothetical protein